MDNPSFLQYFLRFFPTSFVPTILSNTTASLTRGTARQGGPISKWELFRYLGIRLAMCIDSSGACGSVHAYFEDKTTEGSVMRPSEYGKRFHMSRNRFKSISQGLRCSPLRDLIRADEVSVCLMPRCFYC